MIMMNFDSKLKFMKGQFLIKSPKFKVYQYITQGCAHSGRQWSGLALTPVT